MGNEIFVYADWKGLDGPALVGTLYPNTLKGREVFSFEYDTQWLEHRKNSLFDPDLQFYGGRQYTQDEKTLFGVFSDSCPDRWGRLLMKRREAIRAKDEGRRPKVLAESDYLLGIQDESRMGALRFKQDPEGPFLASESGQTVPVWADLRSLEQAAVSFDANEKEDDDRQWVRMLVQPGSSLGGARPKATVRDAEGNLWIAKFPSKKDEVNTGAWEMTAHELASRCGLSVPVARCERFSPLGSTFMTKRFDRTTDRKRIHFVSAMTALGRTDGIHSEEGVSYLDLASVLRQYGSRPSEDLRELWKRIVFNIMISNTDDHLRNHGFLFDSKGLRLSPLYDVNPDPDGRALSLNIDENDNSLDFELAISVAPYFDITKDVATTIVREMKSAVLPWSAAAQRYGISKAETGMMEHCFRI